MPCLQDRYHRHAGFTLIEIIVVLFLLFVITSFALLNSKTIGKERYLRTPSRELKIFAKEALRLSALENRPYVIRFEANHYTMKPATLREEEKEKESEGERIGEIFRIDEEITLLLLRWEEKDWRRPKEDEWIFQPLGMCEPLRVRFEHKLGFIELAFHPLTANVKEEFMEIYES